MLYRILTEDTNRDAIVELASRSFDSFSLVPILGYWKGKPESSLAIELDTDQEAKVQILAHDIRTANKQEAVLVQRIETVSNLVQ
jgi:hypothetical protein